MHKKWMLLGISGLALACGGGGLGALSGGSAKAQALCEYMVTENGSECASVAVGSTATIGDFQVQVLSAESWKGQDTLPAIKNMDERAAVKKTGGDMVAVHLQFTNTSPVKVKPSFNARFINGAGEKAYGGPYNADIYREQTGLVHPWGEAYGPGETRQGAMVFAVPAADAPGSLLYLYATEKKPDPQDPRGRMKTFVTQQFVMDMGGVTAP